MTTYEIYFYCDQKQKLIPIFLFPFYSKPACTKSLIIQSVFCMISSMTSINHRAWRGLMIDVLMSTLFFFMSSREVVTQQTRDVDPVLVWYWSSVEDSGPAFPQHWMNTLCSLGTDSMLLVELWTRFLAFVFWGFEVSDTSCPQIYANIICAHI